MNNPQESARGEQPAADPRSLAARGSTPNLSTLVWRSLTRFRALHLALAIGIAAATSVIVGALVVGDSVRGSLRGLVIERLGRIECAMLAQRFFDPTLLDQATEGIGHSDIRLAPMIVLPSVAVELSRDGQLQRAAQVQALGIEPEFWTLVSRNSSLYETELEADEVALNTALAEELGVQIGDEITVRLPKGTGVPADSPLGRRDEASASLPRQRVVAILPGNSVADLDFRAGQQATRNVFLPLSSLQDALQQPEKVNAAVAASTEESTDLSPEQAQFLCDRINDRFRPTLSDFGLQLARHTRVFPDKAIGEESDDEPREIFDYFQITSDQLIIDDVSLRHLFEGLREFAPTRAMSYLVNEITVIHPQPLEGQEPPSKVTYSIAIGLDGLDETAQEFAEGDSLYRPDTCWVNSWLAERLKIEEGAILQIAYFQPETIEGREVETAETLYVVGILPVTQPAKGYVRNRPARFDEAPTPLNDPDMTPVVPGITDQDSISKWDLPFKLTREVPKEDDEYWQDYRLTPKLFMRYQTAARMFGSRFGSATAIRFGADQVDEDKLRQRAAEAMLPAKAAFGLQFTPIRQLHLQAASGTTPFDALFLALSFFVIVAALMLVAILFRLSIEQRADQWGLLLATGFTHGRVRSLLLRESTAIIIGGVLLGIALGLAYARLMVAGLETWWLGAISTQFLHFGFTSRSLLIGSAVGGLASLATIVVSMWRLNRKAPLDLLRGRWDATPAPGEGQSKMALAIAGFLFFGAIGLSILATTQTGMAQAGSFFGCGMLLLGAALAGMTHLLKHRSPPVKSENVRPGLWAMAWLALTRNPWRSVLTLGLLAVASFLIASMSIFQIAPDASGSGGFELMAQSSLPIYRDLGSRRVREEALSEESFDTLRTATIMSFRARLGEDASCNNLYQVAQPTVLGVPEALGRYQLAIPEEQRFQWAAGSKKHDIPWHALHESATGDLSDPIPVIMDLNTAAWSLHQGASLNAITTLGLGDKTVHFRTVGLLSNSVLQGKLLISDANFERLFPEISGYQFFLIHSDQDSQAVSAAIEDGWSDEGLDVSSTHVALAKLLAVQNTYISAFQAIGALGLLLGTVGLAVVQVRSVLERRRELALLQAIGFSRFRIARLLLTEALALLVGGLCVGITAALIAIVPYMLSGNSQANFWEPLILLAIVLAVGLAASTVAVVTALRQPILRNLQ